MMRRISIASVEEFWELEKQIRQIVDHPMRACRLAKMLYLLFASQKREAREFPNAQFVIKIDFQLVTPPDPNCFQQDCLRWLRHFIVLPDRIALLIRQFRNSMQFLDSLHSV
jgi:hypothetical protein